VTISIAVSNPITHNAGRVDVVNSVMSDDPIVFSAGSLSIVAASTFGNTVTLSGGTLTGVGDLTVAGPMIWSGGTLSGSGNTIIAAGAALDIQGQIRGRGRGRERKKAKGKKVGESGRDRHHAHRLPGMDVRRGSDDDTRANLAIAVGMYPEGRGIALGDRRHEHSAAPD
jgi:hypothetical protein